MQVIMDKQKENHGKWHAHVKDSGTTRSKSEYLFGIYIGPQSMGSLFGPTSMPILWMEEILHRFYNVDSLQPRTPFLTLALKTSRNKFVPMTEILHRLRQNSCQC